MSFAKDIEQGVGDFLLDNFRPELRCLQLGLALIFVLALTCRSVRKALLVPSNVLSIG